MPAIDFPNSPVIGDTHTIGNKTWTWDGTKWNASTPTKSIDDLSDVDFLNLTDGDALLYNAATQTWGNGEFDSLPDQTGNDGKYLTTDGTVASWAVIDIPSTTVSETAPVSPAEGDTWFRSSTGQYFVYYDSYWVEVGAGSSTLPQQYLYGLTYGSSTGNLIIEYNSIDSSQPATAVSDYNDWFMATHVQSNPLSFSIVDGHLIMESA